MTGRPKEGLPEFGGRGELAPATRSAERRPRRGVHLDFLGARPYQAFVQALSRWLELTAERAVLPADDVRSIQRALATQWRDLPDVLDRYVYDPVMIRRVRDTAELALS